MTREQAITELNELAKSGNTEGVHVAADIVLCQLLTALGYNDVVEAYDKIEKWYS